MGDLSELRGLVVGLTTLGVIFSMLFFMPPEFLQGYSTDSLTNPQISNLLAYNTTYNYNFTGESEYRSEAILMSGWYITITETHPYFTNGTSDERNQSRVFQLEITDAITWLNYYYNREDFKWYDNTNKELSVYTNVLVYGHYNYGSYPNYQTVMPISILGYYTANLVFKVVSSRASFHVAFVYDRETYISPIDAYSNSTEYGSALSIQFQIEWSERNTQTNSWDFIFALVFWKDIPYLDNMSSTIIRIPIMICFSYLLFIFVLRILGAVFGGGGA